MKSAFVAILGRPSVGKSTLLNSICGHKVSIVADSPQTTRNKIRGIFTEPRGQIVFVDTPGFHISDKKMNTFLTNAAVSSLEDVEAAVYVLDATRPAGKEEQKLLEILSSRKIPVIPVLNKIDISTDCVESNNEVLSQISNWPEPLIISAKMKDGITELLNALFKVIPEGEMMYPEEYYTDQEPEFRAAEIIREKAVRRVKQEVPHALYVEIADMEQKGEILWIRAFLVVERDTQKGILIGKGGEVIKKIRHGAQRELRSIFPGSVKLDLRVKVNKKWRNKDNVLKSLFKDR